MREVGSPELLAAWAPQASAIAEACRAEQEGLVAGGSTLVSGWQQLDAKALWLSNIKLHVLAVPFFMTMRQKEVLSRPRVRFMS